jgi:SOS-response transcriptional repressor LexA
MKNQELTPKQEEVYSYIAGYITDYGYSPTYQEVAEKLNTTTQSVEAHVQNIAKKGWLVFNGQRNRKLNLKP